jgi:hypothetical protein
MSGYRLRGHRRNGGVRGGTTILGHIFMNSRLSNKVAVESGKNEAKQSPKLLSHYSPDLEETKDTHVNDGKKGSAFCS